MLGTAEQTNSEVPSLLLVAGPVIRFVCRKNTSKPANGGRPGSKFDSCLQRTQEIDEDFPIVVLQLPKLPGHLSGFPQALQDGVAQGHGSPIVHQLRTQANSLEGRRTHLVLCTHETLE